MNQNITGGSALHDGTGGKISQPSVGADTGVRATSVVDRSSGILTSGGSEAPLDVSRPFDVLPDDGFGVLSPSRVRDAIEPSFGSPMNTGIFDISSLLGGAPQPGGAVQGAGMMGLLTGRNLLIAGGLGVVAYLLWKKFK